MTCEACNATILLSEKDRHNERECEARTLNCKYCKMTFNFKDIKVRYLKVPYELTFSAPMLFKKKKNLFLYDVTEFLYHLFKNVYATGLERHGSLNLLCAVSQAHDEICLKFPLQCKDCGKKKIPREKVSCLLSTVCSYVISVFNI